MFKRLEFGDSLGQAFHLGCSFRLFSIVVFKNTFFPSIPWLSLYCTSSRPSRSVFTITPFNQHPRDTENT